MKGAEPLCGHYRYDDPVNYRGRDLAAYEVIATIPAPAVLTSILSAFSNARAPRRDAGLRRRDKKLHRYNPVVSTAKSGNR